MPRYEPSPRRPNETGFGRSPGVVERVAVELASFLQEFPRRSLGQHVAIDLLQLLDQCVATCGFLRGEIALFTGVLSQVVKFEVRELGLLQSGL